MFSLLGVAIVKIDDNVKSADFGYQNQLILHYVCS